ncbi:MAG: hypothetical protein ACKO8Q_07805, partial [Bacteroidota bacterium]
IAAAKNNGTRVIELQHGLISKNDLYYVYEDQYSDAIQNGFFADEFWCLGKYWSDKFKESAESNHIKFVVKGDYRWKGAAEVATSKENVIVITTQKNMARPYLQLIRSVEKILIDYPHWKCQVKLHPLESNSELYVNENYSQQIEILNKDVSIENVLSYAKIQISIYSTTFYDALGYNVFNLALINSGYSEDYVQEMVEEGIALSFQMMENPIERFQNEQTNSSWSRESVFSEYKV